MSMDISNYDRFYKGTEDIKQYGSGPVGGKNKLVKYEFNTTDADGNKVMDKMSREETLLAMRDISSQYGDEVIVEFSGDGLARLVDGKQGCIDRPLSEEEAAAKAAKQAEFDSAVVQMENTYRIVIPNIQTNEKLYNSLAGADEKVVKAANGIIKNYLLTKPDPDMSEQERKNRIAFGMEEARYLAANYLEDGRAEEFLSAMETIAKYGMNGRDSIEKGPNSAGYMNDMDILKEKAPDLYREISELNQRIIAHKDGGRYGDKFLELHKRAEKVLNATNGKGETNREAALAAYRKWEEKIEKAERTVRCLAGQQYDAFYEMAE